MGQKVNPTGFRIGVNKSHDATWYSNYSNYGQTLKEDYLIRNCLKKKWGSLYAKSGITKLQINRKVNKIELLVYATRPKNLSTSSGNQSSFSDLKFEILKLLPKPTQVRLKVVQLTKSENESLLTARLLADLLEVVGRLVFTEGRQATSSALCSLSNLLSITQHASQLFASSNPKSNQPLAYTCARSLHATWLPMSKQAEQTCVQACYRPTPHPLRVLLAGS